MDLLHIRDLSTCPLKRGFVVIRQAHRLQRSALGPFPAAVLLRGGIPRARRTFFLQNAGETNADPSWQLFLADYGMQAKILHCGSGASVVLEHRCFGLSNPYPDLGEET
ncbi:hypothetical protein BDZ89DRAFT_259961 [Hymenopellis radicata]|nr:hypothetical protein BDZ89DRAFT_259961 [Hymenopellis radicata]